MPIPNLVFLSHPVYGATPAATYAFFTKDYKPPNQSRALETDIVINQNGRFKYVYDNGPGFKAWEPFAIRCEQAFASVVGATAGKQYERLREMWEYPGVLGMKAPDGVHSVHWSSSPIEQALKVFPIKTTDALEWEVVVQFEEAS